MTAVVSGLSSSDLVGLVVYGASATTFSSTLTPATTSSQALMLAWIQSLTVGSDAGTAAVGE